MRLDGFIGNEKTIEQLGSLLHSNRFPHALVIEGERGIGKRTLARLLACSLVCRGEEKPCMQCSQCRKAQRGIHPDIFEHSASGSARSFHVETVRQVISDVYMQPNEADKKIYILGNADCMSDSAQNAILKIFEEPPSYAVFILTTENKSSLLDTVLSRSVIVSLDGAPSDKAAGFITEKLPEVDFDSAYQAVQTFGGNIGKAMESLENSKSKELVNMCNSICEAIVKRNEYDLLKAAALLQKDRQSIIFAMDLLKNIFRDALVYSSESDVISGQRETAALLKNNLTKQKIMALISTCEEIKVSTLKNANNALILTKICYELRNAAGR